MAGMSRDAHDHRALQHRTNRLGVEAVSVCSDRQFPRHAHDSYGLGLLDRGAHRTWSPFGSVEAVAGDVITINPNEMHDGAPVSSGGRRWRMIYFDPSVVAEELYEETSSQLEVARPVLRDLELRQRLDALFVLLTKAGDPLAVDEAILAVLVSVLRRHSATGGSTRLSDASIARARQRLDDDPCTAISLAELARMTGLSRFQLIRSFSRQVGVTPHAYQLQARVRAARRFIAGGERLADAAIAAGFSDQSHMTRAFVRQTGVTPAGYREAVKLGRRSTSPQ